MLHFVIISDWVHQRHSSTKTRWHQLQVVTLVGFKHRKHGWQRHLRWLLLFSWRLRTDLCSSWLTLDLLSSTWDSLWTAAQVLQTWLDACLERTFDWLAVKELRLHMDLASKSSDLKPNLDLVFNWTCPQVLETWLESGFENFCHLTWTWFCFKDFRLHLKLALRPEVRHEHSRFDLELPLRTCDLTWLGFDKT